MRHKGLLLAAAAAFAVLPALTPASAGPGPSGVALQANPPALTMVQYYGYPGPYDGGYYEGYYGGPLAVPGEVIGDAAGVVGDVLAIPYAGPYPPAGVAACVRAFRSFDPATGTYTTYSGEQVMCPYLGG